MKRCTVHIKIRKRRKIGFKVLIDAKKVIFLQFIIKSAQLIGSIFRATTHTTAHRKSNKRRDMK